MATCLRYLYFRSAIGTKTVSIMKAMAYGTYSQAGTGLGSRRNKNRQRTRIPSDPKLTARTVTPPLRPAVVVPRFGCRDWKTINSSPAIKLIARSISSIRLRWSSLARACCAVVRTSQKRAGGVTNRTNDLESTGKANSDATVTAMKLTETGSRRSIASSRKSSSELRERYSSRRMSIWSCSVSICRLLKFTTSS